MKDFGENQRAMNETLQVTQERMDEIEARENMMEEYQDDDDEEMECYSPNKRFRMDYNDNEEIEEGECVEFEDTVEGDGECSNRFGKLIQTYHKADKVGDEVNANLAEHINVIFSKGISEKAVEDISGARPANCTALKTPKINQTIWDPLSRATKFRDIKISEAQANLNKAAAITAQAIHKLAIIESETKGK